MNKEGNDFSELLTNIHETPSPPLCPTCNVPIDDHPASRCLDAWVAMLIFAKPLWRPYERKYQIPNEPCGTVQDDCPFDKNAHYQYWLESREEDHHYLKAPKEFSTDIAPAMEVMEKIRGKGHEIHIRNPRFYSGTIWKVEISLYQNNNASVPHGLVYAGADELPLAICRATIKAVKGE